MSECPAGRQMEAELVMIGTELLLGEIVDTNANKLALALRDIGMDLYYKTTVGDNEQRIVDVLNQALDRSNVVITSGRNRTDGRRHYPTGGGRGDGAPASLQRRAGAPNRGAIRKHRPGNGGEQQTSGLHPGGGIASRESGGNGTLFPQ